MESNLTIETNIQLNIELDTINNSGCLVSGIWLYVAA